MYMMRRKKKYLNEIIKKNVQFKIFPFMIIVAKSNG